MTAATCPWCSAELPQPAPEHCPACGASLVEAPAEDMPGLTRIDPEAVLRGRPVAQHPRGLLGLITGEYETEDTVAPPEALAPPTGDVRREMLRMEIEAAEAEAAALRAEVELADAAERAEAEAAAAGGEAAADVEASPTTEESEPEGPPAG